MFIKFKMAAINPVNFDVSKQAFFEELPEKLEASTRKSGNYPILGATE